MGIMACTEVGIRHEAVGVLHFLFDCLGCLLDLPLVEVFFELDLAGDLLFLFLEFPLVLPLPLLAAVGFLSLSSFALEEALDLAGCCLDCFVDLFEAPVLLWPLRKFFAIVFSSFLS